MKAYLSSYRIPSISSLQALAGRPLTSLKCVFILNAKDYYAPHVKRIKSKDVIAELTSLVGLQMELLDLLDYVGKTEDLKKKLSGIDLLWVAGGNTFCLMEAAKASGFDAILSDLVHDGMIYVGESAGAVAFGPSLETVDRADDVRFTLEDPVFKGWGVVDQIVIPHDHSELFMEYSEFAQEYFSGRSDVVFVKDDEVLVIDGDKTEVVKGVDNLAS